MDHDDAPAGAASVRAMHTDELVSVGVARPARTDGLVRVRRGAYQREAAWSEADDRERYLTFLRATTRYLSRPPLLSHVSAAAVWGMPVLGRFPDRLHQIVSADVAGRSRHLVRHRRSVLPPESRRLGFRVTSPAQTIADLATDGRFESAVMAADHALRARLCERDELAAVAESMSGRRGARTARHAASFADPRSESAGESLSRVRMYELGILAPELQREVWADGVLIGRGDFCWEEHQILGEFDGRAKYGRRLSGGQPSEEVVWREKIREDAIRAAGYVVVRWTWADLMNPARLEQRLLRAGVPHTPRSRGRKSAL